MRIGQIELIRGLSELLSLKRMEAVQPFSRHSRTDWRATIRKSRGKITVTASAKMILFGYSNRRYQERREGKLRREARLHPYTRCYASSRYRRIRNRFINVYRRDVLGHVTHQEHQQISDGNNAAHGGDAVADASLYTSGERHDEGVLIELYGLSANQISYQGKC